MAKVKDMLGFLKNLDPEKDVEFCLMEREESENACIFKFSRLTLDEKEYGEKLNLYFSVLPIKKW